MIAASTPYTQAASTATLLASEAQQKQEVAASMLSTVEAFTSKETVPDNVEVASNIALKLLHNTLLT